MPDAFRGQAGGHLAGEVDGVVQVVEHGDRGDDGRRPVGGAAERSFAEEVVHHLDAFAVVLEELLGGGIDADPREPGHRVGVEQRAVVAPDVEHGVAAAQTGERLQGVDLALQVSDHALVKTRAIAVVVAVHLARFERIGKLQQGALAAPQELEGA